MKKIVLFAAVFLYTGITFAQFNDVPDNNVRMFAKVQYNLKSSLVENLRLCHEMNGMLDMQFTISGNWSIDGGIGMWYGNDWNKECGTDFFIGVTYSTPTPVYMFANFHPRFHMQHENINGGYIGDEFSLYGYTSFGCGYIVHVFDVIYMYGETGFNFNFSTRLTSTSDSRLLNDVQLFVSIGVLIRNI